MSEIQVLLPVFVFFGLGLVLRTFDIASRDDARFLLRLVFYVTLPALAFRVISTVELESSWILLPLTAIAVDSVCALIAALAVRNAAIASATKGTVVMSAGIANIAFVLPFLMALAGDNALAAVILYDIGNAIFLATGASMIASRYSTSSETRSWPAVALALRSPLLFSVVGALTVSKLGVVVPSIIDSILAPLAGATAPLVLIALGALVSNIGMRSALVYRIVAFRMLVGLLLGLVAVVLLGLEGVVAVAVVAAASAPIGFNAITLASIGRLDEEHAANALFVSVMIGLATAPAIILLGQVVGL